MSKRHGYLIIEEGKSPYFTTNLKKGKARFEGIDGKVYEWVELFCTGIYKFEYENGKFDKAHFSHGHIEPWEKLLEAEWDTTTPKPSQSTIDKYIQYAKNQASKSQQPTE